MSYQVKRLCGNTTFDFCDNTVMLPPDFNLDDPQNIYDLKLAQGICSIIDAIQWVGEFVGYGVRFVFQNNLEESVARYKEILLNQREFVLPDNFIAFFQEFEVKNIERNKREEKQARSSKPGYVYLLRADNGVYKIGKTTNPQQRSRSFGLTLPFDVTLDHLIFNENMSHLERTLHTMFSEKRINGEWFNLDANDVAYIKSLGGAK